MAQDRKKELLDFLDRRAFDPVIRTKENNFSGKNRAAAKHAKTATMKEKDRFHHYGSAEEVVVNFKRDLHSKAAKRVNKELESLHLPQLSDVQDEFYRLCERLKVAA